MDFGDILIRTAAVAALISCGLFFAERPGRRHPAASWAFGIHAVLLVAALAFLFALFVGRHYEYAYVSQYSSRSLSPSLALAAAWAGQEGSFLLWTAISALVGVALLFQPGPLVRPAMRFVTLAHVVLSGLVVVKTPFTRLPFTPPDGQGLNRLLEDPWMVVHPPVLFLGYAAMLIPAALAMAALLRRDVRSWLKMAWPWTLFAVVTLGAGIALGGVWAYRVLGWGGYWGWDPVENASLIPWLVAVALLHGLMIQRTTGGLTRTNLSLAAVGWITVLGGTFLTRSGVLMDFSVHSFADEGLNLPLTAVLLLFTVIPAALLAVRWKELAAAPTRTASSTSVSRESALWLGMVTVLSLAGLVLVGTTAPLLTAIAGKPASVQPTFYEGISVPLGVALVLLMGLSPALRWFRQQGHGWVAALWPGFAVAVVLAAVAALGGVHRAGMLLLIVASGLALGVNAAVAFRTFRRGWTYGSGYLGHAGVAVMVLGMALSAALARSERLQLVEGRTVHALGYEVTLHGIEDGARGDQTMNISVTSPKFRLDAKPALLPAPQGEGVIRKPAIDGLRELYLAPLEVDQAGRGAGNAVWIERGKSVELDGARVTFTGFRLEQGKGFKVYADLAVASGGTTRTVSPALASAGGDQVQSLDATDPDLGRLSLARLDADHARVAIARPDHTGPALLAVVELSTKPFINLVWIGALITIFGTVLAGVRRAAETVPARAAAVPARAGA